MAASGIGRQAMCFLGYASVAIDLEMEKGVVRAHILASKSSIVPVQRL